MNWILIGIMLTTFVVLGAPRITTRIKAIATQGVLLSALQFFSRGAHFDVHGMFLVILTLSIKAVVIPLLVYKSVKDVSNRINKDPIMSNHLLMLVAGIITIISFFSTRFFSSISGGVVSPLLIPVALTTVLIGFLILIAKTKATNQIIGFITLENGVFAFGMTIVSKFPFMVEIGVLLDVLVGIFIMGVMTYHINKTFDNIDTRALSALGDSE